MRGALSLLILPISLEVFVIILSLTPFILGKKVKDLYKEGITPHIQVHDELDISVESKAHADRIKEIMEGAVDLEVPNKVDYESGSNWGEIK